MFILEMGSHCDLPLKAAITNRAMIRKGFCVSGKMLGEVIFAKETLLTHSALVGLDPRMPHFVPSHISAVGEFHVAHITFEEFSVCHIAIASICILFMLHIAAEIPN